MELVKLVGECGSLHQQKIKTTVRPAPRPLARSPGPSFAARGAEKPGIKIYPTEYSEE